MAQPSGAGTSPGAGSAGTAPTSSDVESDARYEVLKRLGSGGVGTVYKVFDRELEEVIAVKVLNQALDVDPDTVQRFKSELKLARRIHHPNVSHVYHFWRWRGRLAIAQECIEGHSLEVELGSEPLPPERIGQIARTLCSALHSAHQVGVIHRDLKPGNVMIDERGQAHIVDFGLAILTEQVEGEQKEWAVGTPNYMAPEQASTPDAIDHRADVYGLGVLLFRLATGRVPFTGEPVEVMTAHVNSRPPRPRDLNPKLSPQFEAVLLRCLAKDPDDRYDSALDIYEQLRLTPELKEGAATTRPVVRERTVLVIDDDETTRLLIRSVLDRLGRIRCLEAANGKDGVALAHRHLPDFILLDIRMPVMDGRTALKRLKESPATAAIPVAMLTGLSQKEEEIASKEMGAAVFLNKPVQPDVLELLVEKYLAVES